ncbi:MAG: hypothetical protein N2645_00735 [Clostridia bacterium]|nr:hypothetical protein [Clostridia bacterium]
MKTLVYIRENDYQKVFQILWAAKKYINYINYERIVDETSISEIHLEGSNVVLSIKNVDKALEVNRQLSGFKVSGMLSYTQILSGKRITLKEVYFDHEDSEPKAKVVIKRGNAGKRSQKRW